MPLPACHWRSEIPGECEWFICSHPEVFSTDQRVHAGICVVCPYPSRPPPAQPQLVPQVARQARCLHLGDVIGERHCPTCGGGVRLKVFRCRHPRHVETTIRECDLCSDYEACTLN